MLCRLFIDQKLCAGTSMALPDDQAHYLRNVMRLDAGDPIILFNGAGGEFHCSIEQLARRQASCRIESFAQVTREMACRVHIVQAACRSEKIDTVLQKATELGAASFQIVRSERSSLKLDGSKLGKRIQRWQKIIIEAVEQSGRTIVPPVSWHNSAGEIHIQGSCFTLHPDAECTWQEQRSSIAQATAVTLAIGPEGGWSQRDLDKLVHSGFQPLCFGSRIMRTETAAPALLAAIQAITQN